MIVLDLQLLVFLTLLVLAGVALLAIFIDRRRFRDPLYARSGVDIPEIRQALESAPFGLLLLSLGPEYVYANACARHLLGLSPKPGGLPEAAWRAELHRDLATARQPNSPHAHYRVLNLPSEQTLSWWIWPLPNFSLMFLTDLSQPHRLEKASREFLGSLSHELRTPLTAVLAHLEVLRALGAPEEIRQSSLNLIHQEARRIARLVEGLLDLSHLEIALEVSQQPLDLLLVAEEANAEVILEAEARQISISLEADTPLPRIMGDSDRLKQVFLNVLDNAVKYCRTGDKVEVSLMSLPEGVCSTVRDTGQGIPSEHLPHVKQRLYRVRTDVPGSGLGLALAEEILRHHGSRLEIESQRSNEAAGTTVRFLLPAALTP